MGALGKNKKRRRRKAKLLDAPSTTTALQESLLYQKNFVLVSLMIDSFVAVGPLEKNLSKKYSFQVKML